MWMTPKEIYTKTQSGENLQIKGSDKQMITTETRIKEEWKDIKRI